MKYLSSNIKHLRKQKKLTQDELALKIGVKRSLIGSYEEGRAFPKLSLIQEMALYFDISFEDMLNLDLSNETSLNKNNKDITGNNIRVLSTIVDKKNKELITVVPIKAAAGYLNGYADPEYIEELPVFYFPLKEISAERTYRIFQIQGDSMEPLPSASYIITEYVDNWNAIKDGKTYIILTKEDGLVYKRVYNHIEEKKLLELVSDNHLYAPYNINIEVVLEVWKALGYISFELPEPNVSSIAKLTNMLYELKTEVEQLKKQ